MVELLFADIDVTEIMTVLTTAMKTVQFAQVKNKLKPTALYCSTIALILVNVAILLLHYITFIVVGAFIAISPSNCPKHPEFLPECTWGINDGELCEADQELPDGNANYELNNCYIFDVFSRVTGLIIDI